MDEASDLGDLGDLGGHAALVTGAGQVGRAIAVSLARHNAGPIVIVDLVMENSVAAAKEIEAVGGRAVPVAADITTQAGVDHLVAAASAGAGQPIQILVHNAGIAPGYFGPDTMRPFAETDPSTWETTIRLNLDAVMMVTYAFVKPMMASGWGRIVTIVSDAARAGDRFQAAYAAAKGGSAAFMRVLASELGASGITVNCVSLGSIWRGESAPDENVNAKFSRRYPAGRPGMPSDVANLVTFLASGSASWITGQTYPLNGGYTFSL